MAGAMLVLLAACRIPPLKSLIGPEILQAGSHLRELLDAERFIKQVYTGGKGEGEGEGRIEE
ncbi:hypothetical protein B0H65DRAFT_544768 [Neurospora tetraspora]|uniref:Lipoprotein n=1 Tax=Neurospora tetraspora TaxID=94610 RepID=A0AAE0MXW7_9PEZI|nr:hypothetical protein B0H65DRAFT_544768 [Neurospora tetraspora]